MAEAKHTPGPWLTYAIFRIVGSAGTCVALAYGRTDAEREANARLIAATLDLLEACKSLPLRAFEKDMDAIDAAEFVDHAGEFVEAMSKARAAIAKAEGRP